MTKRNISAHLFQRYSVRPTITDIQAGMILRNIVTQKVILTVQSSGNIHQFSIPKPIKNFLSVTQSPELKILPLLIEEKKQHLPELISHELPITKTKYTSFKRLFTGVIMNINKSVFRIDKEKCRVDFCVTEDRIVKRVHSTIYTLVGSWFIEDNYSTNFTYKTYINGYMVKFSNEDFDFVEV